MIRELLTAGMRDPVCPLHGLLPHPDLLPIQPDCNHLMGELLAESQRDAGTSQPRRHHCADHDYAHVLYQCSTAQDILRQVHRRLPRHVLRHGVRLTAGIRDGRLHG
jgi:hypothetical protein